MRPFDDERVAAPCFGDDFPVEAAGVVWTQQPHLDSAIECDIEEGLVSLTLDELGRSTAVPDRLTDSSKTLTRMLIDELPPGGDYPRRIGSHLDHIGEADRVGVAA